VLQGRCATRDLHNLPEKISVCLCYKGRRQGESGRGPPHPAGALTTANRAAQGLNISGTTLKNNQLGQLPAYQGPRPGLGHGVDATRLGETQLPGSASHSGRPRGVKPALSLSDTTLVLKTTGGWGFAVRRGSRWILATRHPAWTAPLRLPGSSGSLFLSFGRLLRCSSLPYAQLRGWQSLCVHAHPLWAHCTAPTHHAARSTAPRAAQTGVQAPHSARPCTMPKAKDESKGKKVRAGQRRGAAICPPGALAQWGARWPPPGPALIPPALAAHIDPCACIPPCSAMPSLTGRQGGRQEGEGGQTQALSCRTLFPLHATAPFVCSCGPSLGPYPRARASRQSHSTATCFSHRPCPASPGRSAHMPQPNCPPRPLPGPQRPKAPARRLHVVQPGQTRGGASARVIRRVAPAGREIPCQPMLHACCVWLGRL
jgi:hypothetical protein